MYVAWRAHWWVCFACGFSNCLSFHIYFKLLENVVWTWMEIAYFSDLWYRIIWQRFAMSFSFRQIVLNLCVSVETVVSYSREQVGLYQESTIPTLLEYYLIIMRYLWLELYLRILSKKYVTRQREWQRLLSQRRLPCWNFDSTNAAVQWTVLIMENCAIHHVSQALELLFDAGALVLFLPPYSPDLNPAEELFSYIKYYLKQHDEILQISSDPKPINEAAFQSVTSWDCLRWIHHSYTHWYIHTVH